MNLARSSLLLFAAKAVGSLVSIIGLTYFAQELGPTSLGIFFLFQASLSVLAIPADFGVQYAVEKRLSEDRGGGIITTAVILRGLSTGLVFAGIILFRGPVNSYIGGEVALVLGIAVVMYSLSQLTEKILNGELRVGTSAGIQFSRQVVWILSGVVLVSLGWGFRGLMYAYIVGTGFMLVLGLFLKDTPFGRPRREHLDLLTSYSKYSFVSSLTSAAYNWTDLLIIGLILTQTDVGAYEVAWRVSAFVVLFSNAVSTTIFPQISEWSSENQYEKIESIIPDAVTSSVIFVIPAFFGGSLLGSRILETLFGTEFTIAAAALSILLLEKVFQAIHGILGRSLQAIDKPHLAARAALVAMGTNIVLNIVLVELFGLAGAATATLISFVLNTLLHARYLSHFVDIKINEIEIGWSLFSSIVMAVVLQYSRSFVPAVNLWTLGGLVSLGVAIYVGVVMLYTPLRRKAIETSGTLLT